MAFYFLRDADLVYICTNVPVFCLKLWSSRTFWQDACCWGIGADFLITAGPGHVIRKLIKVYLKLLISPWKVFLKYWIGRLLLIKQWRERLSLTSFQVVSCFFSSYQQCIPACCKHDKGDGTDIVTLCLNMMGESIGGLFKGFASEMAELWLTRNLVQKFKARKETQTGTCTSGDTKACCI